jgi:hypothetical protein
MHPKSDPRSIPAKNGRSTCGFREVADLVPVWLWFVLGGAATIPSMGIEFEPRLHLPGPGRGQSTLHPSELQAVSKPDV